MYSEPIPADRTPTATGFLEDVALGWRSIAASVAGTRHGQRGIPCQDAWAWAPLPPDRLVLAVSDGAGSASQADLGAQLATQTAIAEICARVKDLARIEGEREGTIDEATLLPQVLITVKERLEETATTGGFDLRDLACTLLVAIVAPTSVTAIQVGDGAIVLRDQASNLWTMTPPQTGEYLNQTQFLTSLGAIETALVEQWSGHLTQLALFSDGLQLLALQFPEATPHAPFFHPLFEFIAQVGDGQNAQSQLVQFLQSPKVAARTDDDLTLILATVLT